MAGLKTESTQSRGDSLLYRLDDRIFAIERWICTVAMVIMVLLVFINVAMPLFYAEGLPLRALFLGVICFFAVRQSCPEASTGSHFIRTVLISGGVIAVGKLLLFYAPGGGLVFGNEVALGLMMWIVMLGSSMAAYSRQHIFLQAAQKLVPENLEKHHMALSLLFAAGFTIFLWYTTAQYTVANYDDYVSSGIMKVGVLETLPIPRWTVSIAVPIGFGLTVLRFVGTAVSVMLGDVPAFPAAAVPAGVDDATDSAEA